MIAEALMIIVALPGGTVPPAQMKVNHFARVRVNRFPRFKVNRLFETSGCISQLEEPHGTDNRHVTTFRNTTIESFDYFCNSETAQGGVLGNRPVLGAGSIPNQISLRLL